MARTDTTGSSRNRLTVFIGLSVLLHALTLLWYSPGPLPAFTHAQGGPIRVKLAASDSKTVQQQQASRTSNSTRTEETNTRDRRHVTQRPSTNPAPSNADNEPAETSREIASTSTVKNRNANTMTNKPAKAQTNEQPVDNQATQQALLVYIQGEISKHFNYPRLARQRGWQGEVLLGFNVNKSGNIDKVHIRQSSGFAVLDQAAKRTLSRVKLDALVGRFPHHGWSGLQLPVIYRLQES